jgi:hypothetical protein
LIVSASASRDEIVGRHGLRWKIRVRAAPERGKANAAVVALVARTVGVQASAISIVSGNRSREKVVEIDGLDEDEVERRMRAAST